MIIMTMGTIITTLMITPTTTMNTTTMTVMPGVMRTRRSPPS